MAWAESVVKSQLQEQAEAAKPGSASARYLYIRAFEDYVKKGQIEQGVDCGLNAVRLYYTKNDYQEAFDLLRQIDQTITAQKLVSNREAAVRYRTYRERMAMYMKLHRPSSALDNLNAMERCATESNDETVKNDLLHHKAVYYYTVGNVAKGNEAFKEMSRKLTTSKDFDKVEEAYKALIGSAQRSGSAGMITQSYRSYIAWKDSAYAIKKADEIAGLQKIINEQKETIASKDSSLSFRQMLIIGLCVLAAGLIGVLIFGALLLLRLKLLNRKQKKIIQISNENNDLKSKFISSISDQLKPTLLKLDKNKLEVKAILDFCDHIQAFSSLANTSEETIPVEDTAVQPFCQEIIDKMRGQVKQGVSLKMDVPKTTVPINQEFVSRILTHLLGNAAEFTPAGGNIHLNFKKRGPHKYEFIVSNTGCGVPEEKRENLFKPFTEVKDLMQGDGLGLPICKQMALKMNGDLELDTNFTKGACFVLSIYA